MWFLRGCEKYRKGWWSFWLGWCSPWNLKPHGFFSEISTGRDYKPAIIRIVD
jgi:hypothetical protein